jgi:hypothetical protein
LNKEEKLFTETKSNKNFSFFSSEKKKKKEIAQSFIKTTKDSLPLAFLTPSMNFSSHKNKSFLNIQPTNFKSDRKSNSSSQKLNHQIPFSNYLSLKKFDQQDIRDVFDVLRLENPQFKHVDNKIRILLCLTKTLVMKSIGNTLQYSISANESNYLKPFRQTH